jgi:hypothetical protein
MSAKHSRRSVIEDHNIFRARKWHKSGTPREDHMSLVKVKVKMKHNFFFAIQAIKAENAVNLGDENDE